MSTVIKDLGAVSAYAYAVEKGYTGTEAEFAELMADYVNVGQRAEDAADSALESKTAAQTAAQTATTKAWEAQTSAQMASTKASEAVGCVETATQKASESAQSASQALGYKNDAESAKTASQTAQGLAESAKDSAISAKNDAESARDDAESARDAVQSSAAQITTNAEDITQLKEDLTNIGDWVGYTDTELKGYFTDAQKAVDGTIGLDRLYFDSANNVLKGSDIRTGQGTSANGIILADFGLTKDNSLIDLSAYPIFKFAIDADAPSNIPINITIWAYTAGGSYQVKKYEATNRTGELCELNMLEWFASLGLSNSYKYAYVRVIATDSYTYSDGAYCKFDLYGFFPATAPVADTSLADRVQAVEPLPYYVGAESATNAPLRLHRVLGLLGTDGRFTNTSDFVSTVTDKIKCSEGDVFNYFGQSSDSVVTAQWFAENGSILSSEKVGSGTYAHQIFTAPENAYTVIFTSYAGIAYYAEVNPALVVTRAETYNSPLSKKVWYPCGDSFTAGEFSGITDSIFTSGKYVRKNKTFPYHIGNRTNVDVRRASTSGETMATYSGGTVVFSDPNYTYGYKSVSEDADYITLWFGINDSGRNIAIGTIDDNDNTTFYGAWNVVLDDLTTRCIKAHIGIIVSNNLAQAYVDAVIAIAKKWGIPYLDFNYDENVPLMHYSLRPTASNAIKAKRNAQFAISSQNHHPNLLAHEYESYFIEKWLLSL